MRKDQKKVPVHWTGHERARGARKPRKVMFREEIWIVPPEWAAGSAVDVLRSRESERPGFRRTAPSFRIIHRDGVFYSPYHMLLSTWMRVDQLHLSLVKGAHAQDWEARNASYVAGSKDPVRVIPVTGEAPRDVEPLDRSERVLEAVRWFADHCIRYEGVVWQRCEEPRIRVEPLAWGVGREVHTEKLPVPWAWLSTDRPEDRHELRADPIEWIGLFRPDEHEAVDAYLRARWHQRQLTGACWKPTERYEVLRPDLLTHGDANAAQAFDAVLEHVPPLVRSATERFGADAYIDQSILDIEAARRSRDDEAAETVVEELAGYLRHMAVRAIAAGDREMSVALERQDAEAVEDLLNPDRHLGTGVSRLIEVAGILRGALSRHRHRPSVRMEAGPSQPVQPS